MNPIPKILELIRKLFGTRNERLIKQMMRDVARMNTFEEGLSKLSDAELRAKTDEFKARVAQGETLEALMQEVFAVVREAAK